MKKQKLLEIPVNHPAFAGHFPSVPIVPGVVLLDEVMHAITADTVLAATAWQISVVKFMSPLKPGESVVIEHEQSANGSVKFEVLNDSRQIVIGSLVLKAQKSAA
jgi:3-hydroxyacyl-[acyl-carrier-protein] dehydratase